MSGAIFKATLSLCLLALVVACGAGPAADDPKTTHSTDTATAASSGVEVFFPELKKPQLTPLLPLVGKLLLDRRGCLRVDDPTLDQDDPGYVPLWPAQYKPDAHDGNVRILDGKGRSVARVGEDVDMVGGEIDTGTLEEHNFMGERFIRELSERCPGRYWLVSDGEVEIPGQG